MPQLDIFSYNLQCFLLTIIFYIFFYFFYNIILIQLLKVFKIRIFINLYINNVKRNINFNFIKYNFINIIYIKILFNIFLDYNKLFNYIKLLK